MGLPHGLPLAAEVPGNEPARLVSPTYFGLHMVWPMHSPYASNFPQVPLGAWRAYYPEIHWFGLEPARGDWQFGKLDLAVRLMASRKVEVMLTLGETPTWASSRPDHAGPMVKGQLAPPRDIGDWENYVRTVAQRYKGRIQCYELWNEPTVREVDGSRASFTAAELVDLARSAHTVIKSIDAAAMLTTPAMVGGEMGADRLDAYFAAGGNRYADVVAFHFYGFPEQIGRYHAALKAVMRRHGVPSLPIWNTEFGYLIHDPTAANTHPLIGGSFSRVMPPEEAAAMLARSLVIGASLGIERFFWFMWDGRNMGLTRFGDGKINAAGVAYVTVADWLANRWIGVVQRDRDIAYCRLTNPAGFRAWIVWSHTYKAIRWLPPTAWDVRRIGTVDGLYRDTAEGSTLDIGASPILLLAA